MRFGTSSRCSAVAVHADYVGSRRPGGEMQCYRLSSVRLDECDTTAFGWTTYINPKHITQKWSDALAQRLPPPPHVPRGAGWISRHIAPPPPLSAALSRQFKALDIDHDGKLTEREFTDALTRDSYSSSRGEASRQELPPLTPADSATAYAELLTRTRTADTKHAADGIAEADFGAVLDRSLFTAEFEAAIADAVARGAGQ